MEEKTSILIVDDDEFICRSLTTVFTKQGYETETVTTGREAIEKAKGRFFNLALLDIKLPDMEGTELLSPLKDMHPDMAVIIVTGYASLESAVEALHEGASAYVTKPLKMDVLLATARECLEKQRLAADKRAAEKALRESEERFRQLAENIHEVFWMSDPQKSKMIYISPAYEEIWGRTCESLYKQPRSFLDSILPEDRERVIASFEKQRRGEFIEVEYRVVRPDGSVRWIWSRAFPVRNESGKFYRIAGLAEDITGRKHNEEALRIKNIAIASSMNAIAIGDIEGNLSYVNHSFLKLWGYDDYQEVLGRPAVDFWQYKGKASKVLKALQQRGSWVGELIALKKDGMFFDTQLSANMVRDEGGKPICMMASFIDITERKQAERQLRKYAKDLERMVSDRTAELANTTAFLNNILDSSTKYAIIATDLKGIILNWNTGAKNIFGYRAEEVVGKANVHIVFDKAFLNGREEENILRSLIDVQTNNIDLSDLRLLRKNGEFFPVDITVTDLRDAQGTEIGILSIIRDITERKMLERQLIQSEKMAGIGTLAAGIAHEIRNPLSIINTSTYLLRDGIGGKTEEVKNLLRQIEEGIKRTQTIINHLLDFSRPAVHELESVDLKNLLEQILTLEGRALSTQNIEIKTDIKHVPKITGNLDSLKHIFLNLLINAAQSMLDGGTLCIRTYQEDRSVAVEISDTGVGIAEKDLPKIFDPFFTTKEPGKGTGLGLAFVHSEIEKMGATIRVESEPKLGSTFIVAFPLREHEDA